MLGLLLALLQSVSIGSIVILEQGPTGLSFPYYINEYSADLKYQRSLETLMYSLPPTVVAITTAGDVYHVSGTSLFRNDQQLGESFMEAVGSIALTASGELIVHSGSKLIRVDSRGSRLSTIESDGISDFDLDRDQCTVVFSQSNLLATANLCESPTTIRPLALRPSAEFFGVRFLPDETILTGSRAVIYQLDRDGSVIRRFEPSNDGSLAIYLDPSGTSFLATSPHASNLLVRFDLKGVKIAGPSIIQNGLTVSSVVIRGEWRAALNPLRRRRPSR